MIASLEGTVSYKTSELRKDCYFVIDVSGVGYKVFTPPRSLTKVNEGQKIKVFTYLAVSENATDLYGFLDPADKTFFTLLLEVQGIGPKSAIQILGKTTMADVQHAVMENNPTLLVTVSGIGQKTAEKIILSLKDKIAHMTPPGDRQKGNFDNDAFDALISFGYTAAEAKKALDGIDPEITDTSQRLKQALKLLSK